MRTIRFLWGALLSLFFMLMGCVLLIEGPKDIAKAEETPDTHRVTVHYVRSGAEYSYTKGGRSWFVETARGLLLTGFGGVCLLAGTAGLVALVRSAIRGRHKRFLP
jgi:hypothetical protein